MKCKIQQKNRNVVSVKNLTESLIYILFIINNINRKYN